MVARKPEPLAPGVEAPGTSGLPSRSFWPLPALLCWLLAWGLCLLLRGQQAPWWASLGLPAVLGLSLAAWPRVADSTWRMAIVAGGFPLSALVLWSGARDVPGWIWLLPLAVLLMLYPVRAWRDAPLFPTPTGILAPLPDLLRLPQGARLLDAGCGAGHGLRELHRHFPGAMLEGVEWSRPLAAWCRLRHPWARVRRGDLWADDWSAFDLVYVFQRPESMPAVVAKANAQMRPGTWLVSLAFRPVDAQGRPLPHELAFQAPGQLPVWACRMAGPGEPD